MESIKPRIDRQSLGKLEMDGIYASMGAGGILLFLEMIAAGFTGGGLITPLVYAGSIIMQERAFEPLPLIPVLAGALVHIAACSVFGFFYGVVASSESLCARENYKTQLAVGAVFGAIIYAVNFHVIARFMYPWFLGTGLVLQFVLHVLAYGVPLAVGYAYLRRWRRSLPNPPSPIGGPDDEVVHGQPVTKESL